MNQATIAIITNQMSRLVALPFMRGAPETVDGCGASEAIGWGCDIFPSKENFFAFFQELPASKEILKGTCLIIGI